MLKMLSNEDNNYLLSLIKENKMVEAVFFCQRKNRYGLKTSQRIC